MQAGSVPIAKDVVLLGAGHAHVGVLKSFGMQPMPGVRLTLVTRQVHTPYSGMLPGLIAGHYDFDQVHIDTGPLAQFARARLYQDEAIGLDLKGRRVLCRNRQPVPYDVLSIDIGSTPGGADVPGAAEHAIPVKPIDQFLERFEAARQLVLAAGGRMRIGIVGGGAAGVELALSLQYRLRRDLAAAGGDADALRFVILSGSGTIVPTLAATARQRLERVLAERRIEVLTGARVVAIKPDGVDLEGGQTQHLDAVLWTTQARAAPWLAETGLALDARGFIAVDDHLQSLSHPGVFAAGDVASMRGHDLPKSGVYAVRQTPVLTENIRRALAGWSLKTYRPQKEALYLVSTGDRYAIGARNGLSVEGAWVWRWKDHIDRKFMDEFNVLPEMGQAADVPALARPLAAEAAAVESAAMRCRGCGAKVGAGILSRVLARLQPDKRNDIVLGLGAPDDAAVIDTGGAQLSVQTVDFFPAFVDDPHTFGRIAANHALGDIYAMGGTPQTALAIAAVPYARADKTEADLADLLAGANAVLADAGCALIGGHTSEGSELALGFAVTGTVARDRVLRKSGLVPGDALILTKPIGTGTLLAAHMRGKAKARWVMAALAHMTVPARAAAAVLAVHDVHAATDVTGFGLVGHLLEMARASGVDVTLRLQSVPVLDGARETVAAGILSSLHPQNAEAEAAIGNLADISGHSDFPLLFDPQTAGGLLAAVPAAQAEACRAALAAAGYLRAAVIGSVGPCARGAASITVAAV
jgi:selenide,water dikinase